MRILTLLVSLGLTACGGGGSSAAPPVPPQPQTDATKISDIQGAGATSPLDGQAVTVRGIVTGDFQENDADDRRNLGGFYIQDGPPDTDLQTSDGVSARRRSMRPR
jgi:predicted extracellular nuclease